MKKILLFAYLSLSLVLVRNEEFRVGSIAFLAPAPAPCPQSDAIQTVVVRQVTVHFYCGVSVAMQAHIVEFIGHALDVMPPGAISSADVYAFTDLDQGVDAEYSLLKDEGYNPSTQQLEAAWLDTGFLGQAFKGAVFLNLDAMAPPRDPSVSSLTVLHEMHHLLQYQLLNSNQYVPLWLLEGAADEFALRELSNLGVPAPPREAPSYQCDYGLADLEYQHEAVPLACAYVEGARAVHLLLNERGQQAYYQLFRSMGMGDSFADAFEQTYGRSLADFYQAFDSYRKSGDAIAP